ncbi:hypothetical protein [Nitrosomonas ureae]|uniref:CAP-Gly protein n=1 Tax=Nitrosomonas ureae TaxID=44577 RepID=A0A2T5I2E5_9PROT|nr:hypothetical protein [Nitrosomonas ureae]PTQ77997.1 hypothetical protein C8R28_10691 [Nitrosomonas ureae]
METRTVIEREEFNADVNRLSLISWGSVLAGLVFCVALSWLLYLLGLAIGVSVTDATDAEAIGSGLGVGAVIWMVLSSLLVFFLGAMLTARLSGKHDRTTGMLHGVTLWGVVTTLMLVLGVAGITGLLQTGQKMLSSTATATTNTATSIVGGSATNALDYFTRNGSEIMDSKIVNNIQARLKRRAAKIIADVDAKGGAEVSQRDISEAIEQLDSDGLQDIAIQLIDGDTEQAKETLAQKSNLSEEQIDDLIEGLSNEVKEMSKSVEDELALARDVKNRVKQQFSSFVAGLDAPDGPSVSTKDVTHAMEKLDLQTMQAVAIQLMLRDTEGAKDILVAHTDLTDAQINDLVDGVNQEVDRTIAKYQDKLNAATETIATYSQAVLWSVFAASAIGLVLSILGGLIGAATTKRLYVELVAK